MQSSKKELREALEALRTTSVVVVGDIILDRYIWGSVDRISPEAPVPVVDVDRVEDRPGGAGNVVTNLISLGVNVSLSGFVGDDDEGKVILAQLEGDGVNREGIIIDRARPTSLKTRVIAHAQQVVRIDREDGALPGVALQEALAAVIDTSLDSADAVVVSDYGKGTISDPVLRKFASAKEEKRVGKGSIPLVLDPHGKNYSRYLGFSVAKPNRKEAEEATGISIVDRESAEQAGRVLIKQWDSDMLLISLGEDGLILVDRDQKEPIVLETIARDVFDVSGAGDTVTALFSAAIASGATPRVAGELANIGAGIVVGEVGTVPVNLDRLKEEIERLGQ